MQYDAPIAQQQAPRTSSGRIFWWTTGGVVFGSLFAITLLICVCSVGIIAYTVWGMGYLGAGDLYSTTGGGSLEIGENTSASLANYEAHNWSFEGNARQQVSITADGAGYADPYIRLIGPDGRVVARNDDSHGSTDATLSTKLPRTGTYTIRVLMWSGGDYELSIED